MHRRALLRAGIATLVAGAIAVGPTAPPVHALTRPERTLFQLVNRARAKHDRPALDLAKALSRKAHRHSARMADRGVLFHHSCLSCLVSGANWSSIGENVGVGETVRSVHRALMNSEEHRRNILSRSFTRIGVGVVKAGGRVWVTEIFVG